MGSLGAAAGGGPDIEITVGRISKKIYQQQPKLAGDSYAPNAPVGVADRKISKTRTQLLSEFDRMSRKDYLKFRNLLIAAGFISETAQPINVRDTYSAIIGDIHEMQQAGNPNLTPAAFINNLIRMNGLDPSKIGDAEDFTTAVKDQLKPSSQTTTSVYDLTPEDARATLEQAMAQKLGRAPTEEEIEDFISAAQTRAERNPTRVTESFTPGVEGGEGDQVTVQREGGEVLGTSVTDVEQGFDSESLGRMADRRAQNAPDYASYQAISSYFPAFLEAMQSTV
jgi:hypothetical protein